MFKALLIAIVMVATCFIPNANANAAWWLTKAYYPIDEMVAGIPVSDLNNQWTAAKVLTRNTFSPEELSEIYETKDFKPTWNIERDLNGDGKMDRVLVGVARLKNKELERFLLILTKGPDGAWVKAYLTTTETYPDNYDMGFSYLLDNGKSISWGNCFDCDAHLGTVTWRGEKYSRNW